MERTMIVQLHPTAEQACLLKTTLEQHTHCFNEVAREGFTTACSNGVELHKRTYYPLRTQFPKLPAQLVCAARVKATEAVKSALTWKVKKEQTYPKIELPFTVPAHLMQYIGNKPCSADLCYRKGRFTLHVVVSIPEPAISPTDEVTGIDLGLNHPAVTSRKQFLGEKHWKEQDRRTFRLRRKLQAKGTRSTKRHLKKLSGKQFRRR